MNGLHIFFPDRAFVQSCLLCVPCEVNVPARVEYFVGTMGLKPVRTLPPAHQPCRGLPSTFIELPRTFASP